MSREYHLKAPPMCGAPLVIPDIVPTSHECLEAAQKEFQQRLTMYPVLVRAGKMKRHEAERELACQKRIVEILETKTLLDEVSFELRGS